MKNIGMYIICISLVLFSLIGISEFSGGLTGYVVLEEVKIVENFVYNPPQNLTYWSVLDELIVAEEISSEMRETGFSTRLIDDSLLTAKRYFIGKDTVFLKERIHLEEDESQKAYMIKLVDVWIATPDFEIKPQNLSLAVNYIQFAEFKKEQAYRLFDLMKFLGSKETEYKAQGIETNVIASLLSEANKSFFDERYNEVEAYLKEAELKLEQQYSRYARFLRALKATEFFLKKFWLEITIFLSVLAISSPFLVKRVRVYRAKKKLNVLQAELKTIITLLKDAQRDYLEKRNITKSTYKIRISRLKDRMNEIKHTIPVLESIITGKEQKKEKNKFGLRIK